MPTNRVKTIDEKIVNRFSKFTLCASSVKSARQLNIRRSRKNMWSLVERAYVDMVRRLCVSLSVTLHEINLVKIRSAIKWDWHELITFHYSKAFSIFSKNILQNTNKKIDNNLRIEYQNTRCLLILSKVSVLKLCAERWSARCRLCIYIYIYRKIFHKCSIKMLV